MSQAGVSHLTSLSSMFSDCKVGVIIRAQPRVAVRITEGLWGQGVGRTRQKAWGRELWGPRDCSGATAARRHFVGNPLIEQPLAQGSPKTPAG